MEMRSLHGDNTPAIALCCATLVPIDSAGSATVLYGFCGVSDLPNNIKFVIETRFLPKADANISKNAKMQLLQLCS